MKLLLHISIVFLLNYLLTHDGFCQVEYQGRYSIMQKNDTLNALLFSSKTCAKNNFAVIDNNGYCGQIFKFNDSVDFFNCNTNIDTLLWIYFFVDKYMFDDTKCKTSVPYSTKARKRGRIFFYYTNFLLDDSDWAARFEVINHKIHHFQIYKQIKSPRLLMIRQGVFVRHEDE